MENKGVNMYLANLAIFNRFLRWLFALTLFGGGLTFSTGCSGIMKEGAIAFKGCSKLTVGKIGPIVVATETAKEGGYLAGEGFLKSANPKLLLNNLELMDSVPELKDALTRGTPIDIILVEHPEVAERTGFYLAKTDRKEFSRLLNQQLEAKTEQLQANRDKLIKLMEQEEEKELTRDLLNLGLGTEKFFNYAKMHKEGTEGLISILREIPPPVSSDNIAKAIDRFHDLPMYNFSDGIKIKINGLYIEVEVVKHSYTLVEHFDMAKIIASGGVSGMTYLFLIMNSTLLRIKNSPVSQKNYCEYQSKLLRN